MEGLIDAKAKCPYYDGFQWANSSEEHIIQRMRYVYEHQEKVREKRNESIHRSA